MLYGFYFDPTYILIIIGMVLCLAASAHVNSTFNKYSRVRSNSGMTGAQAAQRILESQGIYDVSIRPINKGIKFVRCNLRKHKCSGNWCGGS